MKHNKIQQYSFFSYINEYLDNQWLDKIVTKLQKGIPLPTRRFIEGMQEGGMVLSKEEFEQVSLVYAIHTYTSRNGYLKMFIRDLLTELDEDQLEKDNELLNEVIESINLDPLNIDPDFIQSTFEFSDELDKKYRRFIGL